VVVVVPLTKHTHHLIDATALAAMRPDAWLINIARGAILDDTALIDALQTHRLAGAILDVFATEPLPPDHPLWTLDNAVITPHIAGPSTVEELAPLFNDNLARWVRGKPLQNIVDRSRGY
jgi:phosphoglycerate dehydrogenase-like enzyme